MAVSYTITNITWENIPASIQTVTIQYKVTGATSYIVASNNVQVQTNGTLVSPYTISGLDYSTSYTVLITNNCGGSGNTVVFSTGANPCPDITSITGSASNG